MAIDIGLNNPFAEQLEYFRNKLALPSERYDDILRAAHDRAFIVAGAANADLVNDLKQAMQRHMGRGGGLDAFRKEFTNVVLKHGWVGWNGEGSPAAYAWRTRIIYQTNMSTSYAAGRWKQLTNPALLAIRPYWRYIHAEGVMHPRPLHVAWHGMVLHHTHPFWKTHFPPNGWGCHCRVAAVDEKEYEKAKANGRTEPPAGWDKEDPITGAPVGIDRGWDYAPGASTKRPLKDIIDQKLINLDASVGAAMYEAMQPVLEAEQQQAWWGMVDRAADSMRATGEAQLAYVIPPKTVQSLADAGVGLENAAVWLRDDELVHALRDYKASHGGTLPLEVWRGLRELLADAVPYLDKEDQALVYAIDVGNDLGKVLVRINYREKARFNGVRDRITSNFIRTGGIVDQGDLPEVRYLKLEK